MVYISQVFVLKLHLPRVFFEICKKAANHRSQGDEPADAKSVARNRQVQEWAGWGSVYPPRNEKPVKQFYDGRLGQKSTQHARTVYQGSQQTHVVVPHGIS